MKVLEINTICGKGSTGRIACQIADVVVQNGGEATVAYGRDYFPQGCNVPVFRIGSDIGVKIHAGLSRITDRQGFYSKRATKRLIRFIKEYDPDIIHLHNLHGYYLNLQVLFSFLSIYNKPVVWTLHDCWAFTGHCSYFEYIGCDKWKTGCHHCPQKKRYPKSLILDQSKRNWEEKRELFTSVADMTIVTPSYWLAGLIRESFLKKYPVEVIHNGIDLEVFKPTPSSWKEDHGIAKPIVLACAYLWDERKGYADVFKLAELLPDYQIVIVGISEKQAKVLPSSVFGIQRTNSVEELVKIYSAADIFVNPTYEEVLGLVNLEALACGTPVITYNSGGSPECVDDSCGIVVEKENIQELAKNILSAMRFERDVCIAFSQRFSKTNKYSEYFYSFKSLVAKKGEL
ncbi:glycosyltransferase [uncultured Sphaerochaeta sp.]|uniref:glycosyltransferase n=1 Tax=uncultured Sphaerochaeta sp. TaxID=886478 RepID=UPI002AA91C57|nr:glycosyltransferase [uncultured Sphaerochaeta sp.]